MEVINISKMPYVINVNHKNFADILRCENMNVNHFKLGDCIVTKQKAEKYHVVRPCENINLIAKKYNVSVQDIVRLNKINKIFYGQKIRVE